MTVFGCPDTRLRLPLGSLHSQCRIVGQGPEHRHNKVAALRLLPGQEAEQNGTPIEAVVFRKHLHQWCKQGGTSTWTSSRRFAGEDAADKCNTGTGKRLVPRTQLKGSGLLATTASTSIVQIRREFQ